MQSEATKAQLRLTASLCNNLAVAVILLGLIGPFFVDLLTGVSSGERTTYIIVVVVVAAALHLIGYWYLNDIED